MTVTTRELKDRLSKILEFLKRDDISEALFDEALKKAKKYREIIDFLDDDDVEQYLKVETEELEEKNLKKHLEG